MGKIGNALKRGAARFINWAKKKDAEAVNDKGWGMRGRQTVILAAIVGFSCVGGYNLLKYTVLEGEQWRVLANNQQMRSLTIKASRGSIYDANGTVLAQSSTVWDVIIAPATINNANEKMLEEYTKAKSKQKEGDEPLGEYVDLADKICSELSEILGVDREKLVKACSDHDNMYYIVKRKVEKPEVTLITSLMKENGISADCIYTEESSKRYYPNGTLAASILGFTNFDGDGVYGLEAYYDDYLSGTDGKAFYSQDGSGNGVEYANDYYYSAVDGYSLVLTLDEVLQHYLEKNLELCVSQHEVVNRACGIIMNCNTGAVLAMATAPGFDANNPSEITGKFDIEKLDALKAADAPEEEIDELEATLREKQWKNKAITELYYPGSVFKTVTCASALEEEVVSLESSSFNCPGYSIVAGQHISCWNPGGHGTLTLQEAITKSCNPSFIAIGQALGAEKFCDYFEAFGFTEPTGIDLPGESGSLYVPRDRMGLVELASSSFGQTNKVTPIQVATAICAIVNGGYLVTPHLVDKVLDSDGNVVETKQTVIKRQVISEETSETMRGIMENIVNTNGGSNAYISGYRIGGKSGTTERIDEYNAAGGKAAGAKMTYVSSFAAMAPADDPQIVMLVMADTPMGTQYYGSAVAAPVVSAVFKEGLEHLGIYPTYTAEEQAKMDATVPYVLGSKSMNAESSLSAAGFDVRFVGDSSSDATVTTQIPTSGSTIPKGSTVVCYLGNDLELEVGVVPDVTGMTVSQANNEITNAGFNIKIEGGAAENSSALAVDQDLAPGTEVYKGNVITVTFQVNNYSD